MRSKLAAVLVSVAVLAGCGGDDGDAAGRSTTTTEAPAPAAASRLLTLDDFASDDPLDAPWEEGDVAAGVEIVLPDCIDEEAVATDATAVAKFVTVSELKLPSLDQTVTAHDDEAAAEAAFAAAVARLDGCTDPVFTYQGEPTAGTVVPHDLPALGDESKAWRTTVTIVGTPVQITTVHVRVGSFETSLVHTDISQPDDAKIADLAAKAAAHLE